MYNHKKIEKKWQKKWDESGIYQAKDPSTNSGRASSGQDKPKYYCLIEFPYPSGAGLHVGHLRSHIAIDIVARKKRMDGFNVLYPIGWDAFGLPTENFAIKTKTHPKIVTKNNIKNFTKQIKSYGPSFDWSREINTTDPEYYKWTQWIFLKLFNSFYDEKLDKARPIKALKIPKNLNKDEKRKYIDNHRMAYESEMAINWCPSCKIGLANEEVVNGACERCGAKAEKKMMKQWMLKITKYADRLIKDLDTVDYLDKIKTQQVNWIGKSEGAEVKFEILNNNFPYKKIYLASGNKTKLERLKKCFSKINPNIKIEQVPEIIDVEENGKDGLENSFKKTLPYKGKYNYPVIAGDTAVFFENENFDPTHVKRICLKGVDEKKISQKQIADKMKSYYVKLAKKYGGKKEFYYEDYWTILLPDGSNKQIKYKREYFLTDVVKGKQDIFMPMRNLYIVKVTGKSVFDQNKEEYFKEFTPQINGFKELLFSNDENKIKVFTTRPDTLFGCTYMVLSPENSVIKNLESGIWNIDEVEKYIKQARNKSDLERTDLAKEKTGVELKGIKAINPVNNEEIPIWIADYVLASYGTGAIMAVPVHDSRDYEFAKKYNLPIKEVIKQEIEKETNCIIIHGSDFEDKERTKRKNFVPQNKRHWIPWTKKELKKRGIKTLIPLMPKNWAPVYEDWKKEFEKLKINEDTILIGHSLGGNFLVRWLSKAKKKVKKIILVAPSKIHPDFYEDFYKEFDNYKIDEKIKERVDKIIIFISNNDKKYILQSAKIYQRELNAKLVKLEDRGHFIIKHNPINKKFPELLEEILKQELEEAFIGEGVNINSSFLNNLKTKEAKEKITKWLEKNKLGKKAINYKLRDWVFSRQHYWGEPIPIVKCEKCGNITLKEKDLPLELPEVKNYEPTETGESPLAKIKKWTDVKCPKCGGNAKRETDTMPNWAGSSWYFLRYLDPKNNKEFVSAKKIKYWMPVDLYNGGMEHTTLHLLYSRFWHKFLFDLGYVNISEPYKKRRSHGMILAEDGQKMSKSRGNVINPDDIIKKYGADTLRLYEMFIGPYSEAIPWNTNSLIGMNRFLQKVWKLFEKFQIQNSESQINPKFKIQNNKINKLLHQTIKKVTEDIQDLKFNTAISQLMILLNEFEKEKELPADYYSNFLILLSPFAPHVAEELWSNMGNKKSIFLEKWPKYNPEFIKEKEIELVIQINGKVRDKIKTLVDISEDGAKKIALESEKIKKWIKNKEIRKIIFIKGKLINIVV